MNNSSNSFNICAHCGNSNTLNARFCSRCGSQLKVPEEVVVCRSCGTRNSPMANFCRNCGSQLKVGEQTKICPKCSREVPVDANACDCGYSFATISTVQPGAPTSVRSTNKASEKANKKTGKVTSNKGGRVFAIFAFLFMLAFGYFFAAPQEYRLQFLSFAGGLYSREGLAPTPMFGLTFVILLVNNLIGAIQNPQGDIFSSILNAFGGSIAEKIATIMITLFVLCFAVHLLVVIVRMFSGKRSKRANGFYGFMAVLTIIATALLILPNFVSWQFLQLFALPEGVSFGWVICAIPAYYWFFFIYSAIAKAKTIKEQTA